MLTRRSSKRIVPISPLKKCATVIATMMFVLGFPLLASDCFAAEGQATSVSRRIYRPHHYPHAYYPRYYGHGGYYGHYGHGGYSRGYSYGYSPRYNGYYHRPWYYAPFAYYPRSYAPWRGVSRYGVSRYGVSWYGVSWYGAYGLSYYGPGIYPAFGGFYGYPQSSYGNPRVGRQTGDEADDRRPLPRGVYAECYYW